MNKRLIGGVVASAVIVIIVIVYFSVGKDDDESGAAAPPKPTYIKISGVDYPGNDIKHLKDLTVEQCKAECDKDDTCALATMSTDGKNCWLKNTAKSMYENAERDNYFKPGRAYDPIDGYDVVKPAAYCGGTHTYTSPAWALLKPGEDKTLADNTLTGDKLYNDYINRGMKKCDEDNTCKYVSVWRDAGYRTYKDGQCTTHTASDGPTILKKK